MRNLTPIEIAEGALLADVAVVFLFISNFLPFGRSFFSLLGFMVFAILGLRRGLYVSLVAMCVAFFMVCILVGPQSIFMIVVEGLGGIFIGITMKYRVPHILLLLLGIVGGTVFLYGLFLFAVFFSGLSAKSFFLTFHQIYTMAIRFLSFLFLHIGLASQWTSIWYPRISSLSIYLFSYWWITLFVILFACMCPVVGGIYIMTNVFVRLLGYDVRPFPDGWVAVCIYKLKRRGIKAFLKWKRSRKR